MLLAMQYILMPATKCSSHDVRKTPHSFTKICRFAIKKLLRE